MLSRHIKQEVCPWNSPKLVQATSERDYLPRRPGLAGGEPGTGTHAHSHGGPPTDAPSLVELMRMTREEWDVWTRGSAIRRAGYEGFRRNVAVALGNWLAGLDEPPEEAVAVLREALEGDDPLVREHASWALGRYAGWREAGEKRGYALPINVPDARETGAIRTGVFPRS